jgi:ABC-type antimicrobial peptide transport system permease subunit
MNRWRYVFRSLRFHLRVHTSVALGVAAATAVLTGALVVGDSVRGSLRALSLDRLGRIDQVLVSDQFFRTQLLDQLRADALVGESFPAFAPAVLLPSVAAECPKASERKRASQVLVIGCDAAFWDLNENGFRPDRLPADDEVILNRPLAEELSAAVGDEVILRLPKANQVPADSPLGSKAERVRALAGLKVIQVIEPQGLGRFSLQPQQTHSMNAYVALDTLQGSLDQSGRINAILAAGVNTDEASPEEARRLLDASLQPTLEDYGLALRRVRREFQPDQGASEVIYDYLSLTSERMILSPQVERVVTQAWDARQPQAVLTYLATSIEAGTDHPGIPYSLVTAVDSVPRMGPLLEESGQPIQAGDGIVLNSWAADDLQVQPGDAVDVTYFQPESTHADSGLATAQFNATVAAVVPLTEPATPYRRNRPAEFDEPPTLANDPDLTPEVEGVTDQESISRWEAPFPVDYSRVRAEDDDYWENHRTTPKAFVSLKQGQKLWGSRFGKVTSFRVAIPDVVADDDEGFNNWLEGLRNDLQDGLAENKQELGFTFLPVKAQGLQAASGTTDFAGLFLGLSFFVIAAALLLVALLFRLGVEQRASEIGTLFAMGFRYRSVTAMLCLEGLLVAAAGSVLGTGLGVGYAGLMLYGLRTRWVGAVTTPFLSLHVQSASLLIGGVCGLVISMVAILLAVRRARQIPVRELLAGRATEAAGLRPAGLRITRWLATASVIAAVVLVVLARNLGGMAQAGAFVGAGFLILVALLAVVRGYLRNDRHRRSGNGALGLVGLSARSAARNPGRSTLTIGLMATASFLIVAMSAFRLAPSIDGTAGFDLMAETTVPLFHNLNVPEDRQELLADQAAVLDGGSVVSMRLQPGEDASCNNLYQASRPTVLGVPESFMRRFEDPEIADFAWAGTAAETEAERENPWRLLSRTPAAAEDPIPVVLDANMATYSLHLKGVGDEYTIEYPSGQTVRFRVVGLLAGSVLQGRLLIGEQNFLRLYPEVSGYRFFLIQSPQGASDQVARVLEDRLSDQGFDATPTFRRLEQLFAVQNTYLTTFQSLGALGLLLGTFGLATVQLRNVLERRGELALLRAVGFRRRRLAWIVLLENFTLLLGGVLTGCLAAVVAVLPHAFFGGTSPPGWDLLALLGLVLAVGLISSLLPVRATLQAPVVAALRGN